jgi:23S rRNA (cytidine1920-2'-O)/16S rRNA (cytidine1409-2'-O)-methyltransferase
MTATKLRLDALLFRRGLFESRAKAAGSVMAGAVRLGAGRERASKPGMLVAPDVEIAVEDGPRFVSRGGLKLEHALELLDVPVAGRRCLDLGASTGGFTDCLLRRGAGHVVAVDVAYGELDWRIRNDDRVTVLERFNARELAPGDLPYPAELIAVDVSFIGLEKVLPAAVACAAATFDLLALVKPQFEVGRGRLGKGGVVRDPAQRLEALVRVGQVARALGVAVQGFCFSGLPGPAGNRESFIWCTEGARRGVDDIRAAALEAEPDAATPTGVGAR